MSAINKLVAAFEAQATRTAFIPELGMKVVAVQVNMEMRAKWMAKAGNSQTDFTCYSVIHGLTDEDGNEVFSVTDKEALRTKVSPAVVSRLSNFVFGADYGDEAPEDATEEGREKN